MENFDPSSYEELKKQFLESQNHIWNREKFINELTIESLGEPDMYDEINADYETEVEDIDLLLEKHEEFMQPVYDYNQYASDILNKVEKRADYTEVLYRKRYRPKVTNSFCNILKLQQDYYKIPNSIKANTEQHKLVMESINKEKIMANAQIQEHYLTEKELLAEINATEENCQSVIQQVIAIEHHIAECNDSTLEIENIEQALIPQTLDEINASEEEFQEAKVALAEQNVNVSALEQEMQSLEVEIEMFNNQEINYEDQLESIDENLAVLLAKNSLSEIEADDRFQEICDSEYFNQEKSQIIQLQVDNLAIRKDINNFNNLIGQLNAEIEELYQETRDNNFSQVCDELMAEYDEATKVDEELQVTNAELIKSNEEEKARKDNILTDLQQQFDDYQKDAEEKIQKRDRELERYNKLHQEMSSAIEKKRLFMEEQKKMESEMKRKSEGNDEDTLLKKRKYAEKIPEKTKLSKTKDSALKKKVQFTESKAGDVKTKAPPIKGTPTRVDNKTFIRDVDKTPPAAVEQLSVSAKVATPVRIENKTSVLVESQASAKKKEAKTVSKKENKIIGEEENQSDISQEINDENLNKSDSDLEISTAGVKASKGMRDIQFISMFRSDDEESFDTSHFQIPQNLMNTSTETNFGDF